MGSLVRRGNAGVPRKARKSGPSALRPGAGAEFAIGDGAGGARAERLRPGPGLLDLHWGELRFKGGGARACVGVALAGGDQEPEQRFGGGRVHATALLIENAEIVLAVGDAELGRLSEPAKGGRFVDGGAFAAGEIDAEIVHGAAIAGAGGALGPLAGESEVGGHAFAALVELG